MQDDLGIRREQARVAAGVIAVMVGVQDVADRLIADRLHFGEDLRAVLRELVVDQHDAFRRRHHRDIAAVTDDHVQVIGHLLHSELRGLRILRPGEPKSGKTGNGQKKARKSGVSREHVETIAQDPQPALAYFVFASMISVASRSSPVAADQVRISSRRPDTRLGASRSTRRS